MFRGHRKLPILAYTRRYRYNQSISEILKLPIQTDRNHSSTHNHNFQVYSHRLNSLRKLPRPLCPLSPNYSAFEKWHTVVKYIPVLVLVPLYLYVLLYLEFFKNIDRYKLWLGKSFYSPFLVFTIPDKWNLFAIFDSKSTVTRIFFGLTFSQVTPPPSRVFQVIWPVFWKK